jgi:hypothetical protein
MKEEDIPKKIKKKVHRAQRSLLNNSLNDQEKNGIFFFKKNTNIEF